MKQAAKWFRSFAENIAVLLFSAMFLAFVIQIVSRYILNDPYSWTIEASLIAWLWIVFWCAGLLLSNRDHVRFDVLYYWVRPRTRRIFALISVGMIVLAFAISLPSNFEFVTFMKIEHSNTIGIRLDYIFSVYILFALAVLFRYTLYTFKLICGENPETVLDQDDNNSIIP